MGKARFDLMKDSLQSLQSEYQLLKKEKEALEIDAKAELNDLREQVRLMTNKNEDLTNEKKLLQKLLDEKKSADNVPNKTNNTKKKDKSKNVTFDPDSHVPKFNPIEIISDTESENDTSDS